MPKLHLWLLLHRPPPDPVPVAVHIRVAEARAVLAADATGLSDPYVKIRPRVRLNEQALDEHGRPAEVVTGKVSQTLDPVWNEGVTFYDVEREQLTPEALAAVVPRPATPYTATHECGIYMANTRYLQFVLMDHDDVSRDDPLGEVVVSFSDLFGDEDAVLAERSLRANKWFRVTPSRGMDGSLQGALGHLRLDITLVFDRQLLPPGWQEATDADSGATYFYNTATGASSWDEPPEFAAMRAAAAVVQEDGEIAASVAAGRLATAVAGTAAGAGAPAATVAAGAAGSARSTAERYRRGSMDALMYLTAHGGVDGAGGSSSDLTGSGSSRRDDFMTALMEDEEGSDGDDAGGRKRCGCCIESTSSCRVVACRPRDGRGRCCRGWQGTRCCRRG